MSASSGLGEDGARDAIENVIGGGFILCLLGSEPGYSDDATTIVSNAGTATANVAEADVSITAPTDFSGTSTLTLNADVTYSSLNEGVLTEFVLVGSDTTNAPWILGDEIPEQPDTTGEDLTITSGQDLYSVGNA